MMGSCFQRENMAETYGQLSQSRPAMVIHFYGTHMFATPDLIIPQEQLPMSCEQVSILAAQHLCAHRRKFFPQENQNKIGPKVLPLFGLYASDHTLQQWIPDAQMFKSSASSMDFYFRVRVRPATEKITEGLFADYLFWQCAEDFLTGRVWSHFEMENKIRDVNDVNKNVLYTFMASGRYLQEKLAGRPGEVLHTPLKQLSTLKHIKGKVTLLNVHRLLPQNMTPELQKEYNINDPFMRLLSRRYLHSYIKDFYEKWGDEPISRIRLNFVKVFLSTVVPYYLLEYFPAQKVENYRAQRNLGPLPPTSVELVIKPYQDGCVPGLYFNTRFKAHMKDIFGAEISECESVRTENQPCCILLKIHLNPPMILDLPNQGAARSFLSVLETYWRLKYNYYDSLNTEQLAAPTLRVLQDLHAFGPMEEEEVRCYLRQQKQNNAQLAQCEALYMVYQDIEDFYLLHALGLREEDGNWHVVPPHDIRFSVNGGDEASSVVFSMKVGSEEKHFTNKEELLFHLKTTLSLGIPLYPKEDDVCGAMQFVQDDHTSDLYYSYAGMESERTGKKRRSEADDSHQPKLYRDDEVPLSEMFLIERREFCDVFRFKQMAQGREAILKKVTGKSQTVQEAYRKGAQLLLKLRDRSHFFVQVYGLMITSPTRIIYECMPDGNGSLLKRLRDVKALPLNGLQVASVLRQLLECLCSLKEAGLFYGNFCCAKVLIKKETEKGITIRLGDPSLSLFYNDIELEEIHNDGRLAWLAPERWVGSGGRGGPKIAGPTLESEVYSLGTTIWEILHQGKDPKECIPHGKKTQDFFKEGCRLPDPEFQKVPVGVGGDAGSRTQQWVDNQDFAAGAQSGEESGETQPYHKVAMAQSTKGSNVASGDTVTTELSGEGAANPQEQSPPVESETELSCKMQEKLVSLMHDCWHREPHQRPAPLTLMKAACEVEELAEKLFTSSPVWHLQVLLSVAKEVGIVQQDEELQQRLQEAGATQAAGKLEHMEEVLEDLESQVRQKVESVIENSRVRETGTRLGEGQFGQVLEADLYEASETRAAERAATKQRVAVKVIKKDQAPNEIAQFLREALNICKLDNENVVKMQGIVMKGRNNPYKLVLEYADSGNLETYVCSHKHLLGGLDLKKELHWFAKNIVQGMKYICEEKKMIHGDLATRNVLLFSAGGTGRKPLTAKLSDFGLSHKLTKGQKGEYYYDTKKSKIRQGALPVFWMPPEIVETWNQGEHKYTVKTDVWSFGVTLWEMFSEKRPENELNKKNLKDTELIAELNRMYQCDHRLPKPNYCPAKVYAIMGQCWKKDDNTRPDFTRLAKMIWELEDDDLDD